MEDDERHVLCTLHELIDLHQEAIGRRVVRALDVSAAPVVVPDIDDAVVLPGDLVALDDLCEFLRECASRTERAGESALRLGEERLI